MKKLVVIMLILGLLVSTAVVFAGGQQDSGMEEADKEDASLTEQSLKLRFIGASPGGTYFIVLGGMSETLKKAVPNWDVSVEPGSSMSDVIRIARGEGDLALSQHTAVIEAINDEERKEESKNIRSLGAIATSAAQFIVGEDVSIDTFEEFVTEKPKLRVSLGPTSETHYAGIKRLLAEYDLTPEDIEEWGGKIRYKEMGEATDLYSAGGIEGYFLIALTPTAPTTELSFSHDLKMLKIKEDVIDSLTEKYNYAKVTLPENTYDFISEPTMTFAAKTITVVNREMPDEVAYNIVKSILDNMEEFKSRHAILKNMTIDYMINPEGVPLHDGAIKAYKEAGADLP